MNNMWKAIIGAALAAALGYGVAAGIKKSREGAKASEAPGAKPAAKPESAAAPEPEILDKRPGYKECFGCGEKVAEYDFFCPACGSALDQIAGAPKRAENRV